MKDYVSAVTENKILDIKLERHHKKNALTEKMYLELSKLISNASEDVNINAILISGGKDFTAGNDLEDFIKNPPRNNDSPVFKFMRSFSECPLPIIASVDGFAVGIGTTMLLHSDLVYASKDSVFLLPFIDLGVVPEFGSSMLLTRRLGYVKAAEMLMLGDRLTAEKALELRLINSVLEKNEVYEFARKTAKRLAKKPRKALLMTKKLMRRDNEKLSVRIDAESKEFTRFIQSKQTKDILKNLQNK